MFFSPTLPLFICGIICSSHALAKQGEVNLQPLSAHTRLLHARELLGKKYEGSIVHSTEGLTNLESHLYKEVNRRLPKKYKSSSLSITKVLIEEAAKHDFDPFFLLAVIQTESSFNPEAKGGHGEIGLMQLRPPTAEWIAQKEKIKYRGAKSLANPVENIRLGSAYLGELRKTFANYAAKYLAAYNMGPSKVRQLYASEKQPKEYAMRVMRHYKNTYKDIVLANQLKVAAN